MAATSKSEKKKKGPGEMTAEHKAALAAGREEGRAIRLYLDAFESHKPRRGRKRTPESVEKRLEIIDDKLRSASGLERLHLVQERIDLQAELTSMGQTVDLSDLEAGFVKYAGAYSKRRGLTKAAWREIGIPADLLRRAGI